MWPVWTKFVGLPIIDRSIFSLWWWRRTGGRWGLCGEWKQHENHCIQMSPTVVITSFPFEPMVVIGDGLAPPSVSQGVVLEWKKKQKNVDLKNAELTKHLQSLEETVSCLPSTLPTVFLKMARRTRSLTAWFTWYSFEALLRKLFCLVLTAHWSFFLFLLR